GEAMPAHHQLAARPHEPVVHVGRLVVQALPVRALAQQFDAVPGPAVEQPHQLVVVVGAHEVAARRHLAEIADRHRYLLCHASSSLSPASGSPPLASCASAAPATVAGSCRPRCQSPPLDPEPGRRIMRMTTDTETSSFVHVSVLLSSRSWTEANPIRRASPLPP